MDNWISSTRLRRELTDVLAALQEVEEPLTILHRSRPVGILWSYDRFQRLMERLEGAEDLLAIHDRAAEPVIEFEDAVRILEGDAVQVTA